MVSNAITKVFEFVHLDRVMTAAPGDEYQFGFKAECSTEICTSAMRHTTEITRPIGTEVAILFVHLLTFRRHLIVWISGNYSTN